MPSVAAIAPRPAPEQVEWPLSVSQRLPRHPVASWCASEAADPHYDATRIERGLCGATRCGAPPRKAAWRAVH